MGTDRRTDMTKLIVAYRKFEKTQKKHILEAGIFTLLILKTEGASTVLDETELAILSPCGPRRVSSEQRNKHST
jgi:hypothetical protein